MSDWPTPTVRDQESPAKLTRGANASPGGTPLVLAVLSSQSMSSSAADWPTPTVGDATGNRMSKGQARPDEGGLLKTALTASRPSMSSSAASPAKTSPTLANARGLWRVRVPASGESLPDLLASYDRELSVWKTSQGSLLEDSTPSSVIWPRSGMTRSGRLYALPMSARPIDANGCSLWLTPRTQEDGTTVDRFRQRMLDRGVRAHQFSSIGQQVTHLTNWPTPVVTDASGAGNRNLPGSQAHAGLSLTDVVTGGQAPRTWPTPRAEDSESSGARVSRGTVDTLTAATRDWMTPQSYSAPEGMGKPTSTPLDRVACGLDGQLAPERDSTGGSLPARSVVLNPAWVSCLMGFPPDWCDIGDVPLPRSGTPSSRKSPKSSRGA